MKDTRGMTSTLKLKHSTIHRGIVVKENTMKKRIVLIASLLSLVATVGIVEAARADSGPTPVVTIDDHVSVRMSGEFLDGSCCLVDPFTGFVPRLDVSQFGGRDLLVEYVSCQALIPSTQPVNLYIGENGQDAPLDALIAIELSEQFSALAADGLFGTALHGTHAVKVIVDSGDDLLLNGRRPLASTGVGRVSCVVAGRLVN